MGEIKDWYENLTYEHAKDILRENLYAMRNNFIAAGYYMKYIRDNEMYLADGYGSIWEFAEDNYGIRKSTASRWMAMNDKFSRGGNSPVLAAEYRGFEKSQLQEMLYLDDKQIQAVAQDMTVKEIREIRKPETPELKKPDETEREYLKAAARNLIIRWRDWFREDYMNRVMQVDKSPGEIREKLGKNNRQLSFLAEKGVVTIELFSEYIRIWNEKRECLGDFDWFYLAAAIQSMWNIVAMEDAQEKQAEAVATSQQGKSEPDQVPDQDSGYGLNQDADLPEERQVMENPEEEVEIIDAEIVEDGEDMEDGKYMELSDKTDLQILHDLLDSAKEMLRAIQELYADEDIRTRKHKLMVAAYAGMIADLDVDDIVKQIQPELPEMKNNTQRKEFLKGYQRWPVWFEVKEASEIYYRFNLPDGSSIVICEYHMWLSWKEKYSDEDPHTTGTREYLLTPGYHYLEDCKTNTTTLIEHLKNVQRKGN